FLGDAPVAVEQRVASRYGARLRAQVLKVGHHGSSTSTGDALLAATQPALELIPVGRQNRYGHPAPDVLARLQRRGIGVLRTDERGAILVRANATGRLSGETEGRTPRDSGAAESASCGQMSAARSWFVRTRVAG